MAKPQKKTKSKSQMTAAQQRLLTYSLVATFLVLAFCVGLWSTFVTRVNAERFEKQAVELAQQQQQAVAAYVADVSKTLVYFIEQQKIAQRLQRGGLGEPGYELQQDIQKFLPGSLSARVFTVGQAQQEKEAGSEISFVEVNMINRAERGRVVFPEAAKRPQTNTWVIHWAVPIHGSPPPNSTAQFSLVGVLSVTTSIEGLTKALSRSDLSLAQSTLVQRIGSQRILKFISVGNGSGFGAHSITVPDTHWTVELSPSALLRKQAATIPLWVITIVLLVAGLAASIVWKLLQRKAQQEKATTQLFKDIAKSAAGESPEGDGESAANKEKYDEASDPIYLTDRVLIDTSSSSLSNVFRAYDIRGIVGEQLTPEFAESLGKVLGTLALEQDETVFHVGHDARVHSPELCAYLQQGILSTGCDVIDLGLVPTPLVNFAVNVTEQSNSGVMVTASHNPKAYNGFKMIINRHSFVEKDIQQLKTKIENQEWVESTSKGSLVALNYAEDYIDTIIADIAITSGMRVVVDAANGAASQLAPSVLEALGCDVIPLCCEFNGEFPNHDPDPSVADNLQMLIERVAAEKADLGLALDGDGDRLVVVTGSGKIVWPDQLLMIFAKDVVSRNPGCDVVFDIKSTRHLSSLITSYGGRPIMWKTGHSNIKAKLEETGALLAGEFSGHIFFKERWYGFDDGIYAAARLLEIMSLRDQSLDDILMTMPEVVGTPEIKIPMAEDRKFTFVNELIAQGDFESGEKVLIDGLRVDFIKGWGLVRASNTSPAITLRFEGDDADALEQFKKLFKRELAKIDSSLPLDF